MKTNGLIFFVILLIVISAAGYMGYQLAPGRPIDLVIQDNITQELSLPAEAKQFYPNMRFPSSNITYIIDSDCEEEKREDVIEALNILEEKTILSFSESSDGEIEILCAEIAPEPEKKDYFVAGEGGPTEVVNTTLYSVIFRGKVSLYRDEQCKTPHIALHEILHALGFDHSSSKQSIMYPTLDCSQTLGKEFIESINEIYKLPKAADLKIVSANGTKSGAYLDFGVEVINQGLDGAELAEVSLYSESKLIKKFSLDNIPIGTKKILSVTNLKIPRSAKSITLKVDADDKVKEIFEDNNEIVMAIS